MLDQSDYFKLHVTGAIWLRRQRQRSHTADINGTGRCRHRLLFVRIFPAFQSLMRARGIIDPCKLLRPPDHFGSRIWSLLAGVPRSNPSFNSASVINCAGIFSRTGPCHQHGWNGRCGNIGDDFKGNDRQIWITGAEPDLSGPVGHADGIRPRRLLDT